jgi:hypothetical protein
MATAENRGAARNFSFRAAYNNNKHVDLHRPRWDRSDGIEIDRVVMADR